MDPAMQSVADLKKIFQSFDLDKSGSIDLKQLGSVASKLGKEIPPEELASIMKKLDANKDGKISFGEFEYWWIKGVEGKMMELVYLKAKSMKMSNFLKKKAAKFQFLQNKGNLNVKTDKFDVRVHFGTFMPECISLDIGFYIRGQKQADLRKKITQLGPKVTAGSFGVVIKLNSKNPSQAKAAIDLTLNSIIKSQNLPIKVASLDANPFLTAQTFVRENDIILSLKFETELVGAVTPMTSTADSVLGQIGQGFYMALNIALSLNSTFDNLLDEPIINSLLKGFNAHIQFQANNSALGNLRKYLEKKKMQLPAFLNFLTLIRCAKFHLGIKSPQQLSSFFKKLGINDIVGSLPNVKDLLEDFSPMTREIISQEDNPLNSIYKISKLFHKHIQNDVQIFILGGSIGAGYIRAQGKNASKIYSILFNEI